MSKSKTLNKPAGSKATGLLIVISAPSGCGKTTIADRLLRRHPDWVRSVSATTRAPRSGEKDGEDYFFLSEDRFKKMQEAGDLLESASVFGREYGTPKKYVLRHLQDGKHVLLTIDVQGTKKIRKTATDVPVVTFFILPPSIKVLRERLEGRNTDSPEEIQKRIEAAQEEIKEAGSYDYAVVNQNVEQTVLEMEKHLEDFEKNRRSK